MRSTTSPGQGHHVQGRAGRHGGRGSRGQALANSAATSLPRWRRVGPTTAPTRTRLELLGGDDATPTLRDIANIDAVNHSTALLAPPAEAWVDRRRSCHRAAAATTRGRRERGMSPQANACLEPCVRKGRRSLVSVCGLHEPDQQSQAVRNTSHRTAAPWLGRLCGLGVVHTAWRHHCPRAPRGHLHTTSFADRSWQRSGHLAHAASRRGTRSLSPSCASRRTANAWPELHALQHNASATHNDADARLIPLYSPGLGLCGQHRRSGRRRTRTRQTHSVGLPGLASPGAWVWKGPCSRPGAR